MKGVFLNCEGIIEYKDLELVLTCPNYRSIDSFTKNLIIFIVENENQSKENFFNPWLKTLGFKKLYGDLILFRGNSGCYKDIEKSIYRFFIDEH